MQQDAGEVVPGGIQPKQRDIQRMRHPGQRMPVRLLGRSQRPFESVPQSAPAARANSCDVTIVVVVHERMVIDRVVERKRDHRQQQTDDLVPLLRIRKQVRLVFREQHQDLTTEDTKEHRGGSTEVTSRGNC